MTLIGVVKEANYRITASGIRSSIGILKAHKMLKYNLDGRLIYAWGTIGDFPGTLWGVHGISTDQEGNLYVAEVDAGRFQQFRPHVGAPFCDADRQARLLSLAVREKK